MSLWYGMIEYVVEDGQYSVFVYKENTEISSYTAGNSPDDSQVYLDPENPNALSRETLEKYAKQTALEMAGEYDIPVENVHMVEA